MACAPDSSRGAPLETDPVMEALHAAVASARGPDPLAPATVVAPSAYAALAARRTLGACAGPHGRRGIANVSFTTVDKLIRQLGLPVLASRGLRPAPHPVDLEAIRTGALSSPGWLAELVGHPRGLLALRDAVTELRRCPAPTLAAMGRRLGRIGDLVRLLAGVRSHLHEHGFAESVDLVEAATAAVTGSAGALATLGPVLCFGSGVTAPSERRVLDLVAARTGTRPIATDRGDCTLTEVRACADPDDEVRAAVRAVVTSVDGGGASWRLAIFHPPGPAYPRALHQALAAAGVAANGPETRRLDRSVAGSTLLGLLDLAASDWTRHDVMTWLAGAPVVAGPDRGRVPVSRWDSLSSEAGVVRGASQWGERLGNLATRHAASASEAEALAAFVDHLVKAAVTPSGSWTTRATWAVDLLDQYLHPDHEDWPADEVAAREQVRGAVLALGELDAVSERADHGAFQRAVRTVLEETGLDTSELPDGGFGDGVFVAPFGRARGLRFGDVFLVGMADALVPGAVGDDALLPEDVRRLDISGGLRTRASRLEELHDNVLAAVGAGATRRVASYPRLEPRTGRAQVPSRWTTPLTGVRTRWRSVDSFAAGIAAADPPLSVRELELHDMVRFAEQGGDPALSPVARHAGRLRTGIDRGARQDGWRLHPVRRQGRVGRRLALRGRRPHVGHAPRGLRQVPAPVPLRPRVAGLRRTLPEELWQMEPPERGTLVHAILEEYLLERLAGAPRSLPRLLAVAETHFAAAEGRGLVGKALLWRMDKAAMRRDLARFHDEEGDLEPLAAELEFGTGAEGADPPVVVTLAGGREVHFKGKADRVDRAASGELVVSDYKTGKQRMLSELKRDPVAGGRLLQLPIYALAARARFGGETVRARYWLLSEKRVAPCYSLTITDEVQARFDEVLALIADAVEAGAFPGAPAEKNGDRQFDACRSCDFDVVCPVTRDRQWARKRGAPELAPVLALMNADVPDDLEGAVVDRFGDAFEVGG